MALNAFKFDNSNNESNGNWMHVQFKSLVCKGLFLLLNEVVEKVEPFLSDMLCECFTAGRPLVHYRSSFICIIETLACLFATDLADVARGWPAV